MAVVPFGGLLHSKEPCAVSTLPERRAAVDQHGDSDQRRQQQRPADEAQPRTTHAPSLYNPTRLSSPPGDRSEW